MQNGHIIAETSRLLLRQFTLDDLEPLAAIHMDPEVCRFIGGVKTVEQSRQKLEEWIADYERYGFAKWAVVLRNTGELIGRCGLELEDVEGTDEWELGWTFARRFWSQGYATEAASAVLHYWFHGLRKQRVISLIRPPNLASKRVAQRLGMKYDRTVQWGGSEAEMYVALASA